MYLFLTRVVIVQRTKTFLMYSALNKNCFIIIIIIMVIPFAHARVQFKRRISVLEPKALDAAYPPRTALWRTGRHRLSIGEVI